MSYRKTYQYELSYNPYNFYFSTNRQDLPNDEVCQTLKQDKEDKMLDCDEMGSTDKCYQYELCKNQELAKELYEHRFNHETSEASYQNLLLKYNYGILKTVNLSAGIVGALVFIYYYNK